ncbi:hypothetical protein WSS15_23700 [Acetobacter pasteurianus]|nr:hypothetical protein WSS15_23700 [Acetobacter pasteurianus]
MEKVNIERRAVISERVVYDVSETIIETACTEGADNMRSSQRGGRFASFRSREEAEEYVRLLKG